MGCGCLVGAGAGTGATIGFLEVGVAGLLEALIGPAPVFGFGETTGAAGLLGTLIGLAPVFGFEGRVGAAALLVAGVAGLVATKVGFFVVVAAGGGLTTGPAPPLESTPHFPISFPPGSLLIFPEIVSGTRLGILHSPFVVTPPGTSGQVSIPREPALQVLIIACKVLVSQPLIYQ